MFSYVLLVALVAAVAVAFVARGRERMASTSVMSIIGLLVVDAMDRAGAHDTIPFWHWGAVAAGTPLVLALVAPATPTEDFRGVLSSRPALLISGLRTSGNSALFGSRHAC